MQGRPWDGSYENRDCAALRKSQSVRAGDTARLNSCIVPASGNMALHFPPHTSFSRASRPQLQR